MVKNDQVFPGGSVVKNSLALAGDKSPTPDPGRSHVPWNNKLVLHNYWAQWLCSRTQELQPLNPCAAAEAPAPWSPCSATIEVTTMRNPHTATGEEPLKPQRLSTAKINKSNYKNYQSSGCSWEDEKIFTWIVEQNLPKKPSWLYNPVNQYFLNSLRD